MDNADRERMRRLQKSLREGKQAWALLERSRKALDAAFMRIASNFQVRKPEPPEPSDGYDKSWDR